MERRGEYLTLSTQLDLTKFLGNMARYSLTQQWEDIIRRRQEAEDQGLEAQRRAAHRAAIDQIDGPWSLRSVSAGLPGEWPQLFQDPRPSVRRRQAEMPELEDQRTPPPQYRQQTPFPPLASDGEALNAHTSAQIKQLQDEVAHKESEIKNLEYEAGVEKDRRLRLQAERHEAVDAQRRANDELGRLKRQVANLDELLDGSIKREKELESELDSARQEISELKRQIYEEQSTNENDMRAKEKRERQMKQQLEDTHCALEDEIRMNRHTAADHTDSQRQAVVSSADMPRRARRSDRSTSGRAYISIPKGSGRRRVITLS